MAKPEDVPKTLNPAVPLKFPMHLGSLTEKLLPPEAVRPPEHSCSPPSCLLHPLLGASSRSNRLARRCCTTCHILQCVSVLCVVQPECVTALRIALEANGPLQYPAKA